MSEDRLRILAMLKEGKISVDEASQLLEAMELDRQGEALPAPVAPQSVEGTVIRIENAVGKAEHSEDSAFAGAFLLGARIDGALTDGANLRGAFLLGADLRGADLRGANLSGVFMPFADLQNADLRNTNLNGAFMPFANGAGGSLANKNLSGAFMPFTRFFRRQQQTA